MKFSFFEFYQKIKENAPAAPGAAPAQPGAPAAAPKPAAPGAAPTAPGAAPAPAAGGQTSPPVPPPDPKLQQGLMMLAGVTDPKVRAAVAQFQKQLQGAGIQVPGSPPQQAPAPAPAAPQPSPAPQAGAAPGQPPKPPGT